MSIHDAIVSATESVLGEYLAPDLATKLTQEIVERARFDMEAALSAFVGYEIAKPAPAARGKAAGREAAAAKAKPAKRKKERAPTAAIEQNVDQAVADDDSAPPADQYV